MLLSGRGLIPLTRATYRHIVTPATLALGIIDASGSFVTTTVRPDPYNRHSRCHLRDNRCGHLCNQLGSSIERARPMTPDTPFGRTPLQLGS